MSVCVFIHIRTYEWIDSQNQMTSLHIRVQRAFPCTRLKVKTPLSPGFSTTTTTTTTAANAMIDILLYDCQTQYYIVIPSQISKRSVRIMVLITRPSTVVILSHRTPATREIDLIRAQRRRFISRGVMQAKMRGTLAWM